MKYAVQIEDFNFEYKDTQIFKNLDLKVEENTFTTILGANGSGKTTLVKLLLGLEKGNSVIMLNHLPVIKENLKRIYKAVSVVFESTNNLFVAETVTDELAFSLENLNYSKETIKQKINKISKLLNIIPLLEKDPNSLNAGQKQLVALAAALITNPKILIIDEGLNNLNEKDKIRILNTLKEYKQNKKMTIIYLTHNSNDSLYSDNIIILGRKNILASNSKEEIYINEKIFKIANLELPFIINLSKKLQFYDLIDEDYQDAEKLVDILWK